jgi:hypothetical protein
MLKPIKLIAALLFVVGVPSFSADTAKRPVAGPFLCISDQVAGFRFDNQTGSWLSAIFAAGQKFVVRRNDGTPHEVMPGIHIPVSGAWAVWTFGDDRWPTYTCNGDFTEYGYLQCEGSLGEKFSLNLNNGRFITESTLGYIQVGMRGVDGKPLSEGSNTPSMSIGKCSAL